MIFKRGWTRLLSLAMAVTMLSSVTALAAPAGSVEEAKQSLGKVEITQVYTNEKNHGSTGDHFVHDYRISGDQVDIDYSAKLFMTEEMALYLQPREKQLMKANFEVTINMDMDWLEFRDNSKNVTVKFSSTFLKPCEEDDYPGYTYDLISYEKADEDKDGDSQGIFTYELTMPKSEVKSKMVIPMELIVYYDGEEAYGYEEAKAFPEKPVMYADFTAEDWMHAITLEIANLKVKDEKAATVTTDKSTWYTVDADGIVEGDFTYISDPSEKIGDLMVYEGLGYTTELEFGNDLTGEDAITGWESNVVDVLLKRSTSGGGGGGGSELLNTDDHYSYIIGYKDGFLRPYGTISRGEVVTIFFRMLTDETRDKYWSQTNPFSDCNSELWCNNAISTLYNMSQKTGVDIIGGFKDGTFRPYGRITRAQFAKIAVGFFEETAKEYEGTYTDVEKGEWYTSYIEAAARVGLINGFEDGTFRPNDNITRAQACAIVNRALDRHPDEDHLLPTSVMVNWPDNDPDAWYYADMMEATNSHDHKWVNTGKVDENGNKIRYEKWTEKLPQRDWAAYEHAWSDSHSSKGGEVVKD